MTVEECHSLSLATTLEMLEDVLESLNDKGWDWSDLMRELSEYGWCVDGPLYD